VTDYYPVERLGAYRVVLGDDEGAYKPEASGQSPLLQVEPLGHGTWLAQHIQVDGRPAGSDARIEEAAARLAGNRGRLEGYLRGSHGARHFEWYENQDYKYLTYDTTQWRDYTGLPHEGDLDGRLVNGGVSLSDYRAWCEGEVYYYLIQESMTWTTSRLPAPFNTRQEWTTVDWEEASCGSLYGRTWVEKEAREAWDGFLGQLDPRICATCGEPLASLGAGGLQAWRHQDGQASSQHDAAPAGTSTGSGTRTRSSDGEDH
jgi:hypothetical protein